MISRLCDSRMDEVLVRTMTRNLEPIEWDETTTTAAAVPEEATVEEEASTLSLLGRADEAIE